MHTRSLSSWALCAVVCLAFAGQGCERHAREGTGGARIAIASDALLPSTVAEVVVTVSPGAGPAFTPFSVTLSQTSGGWSGFITGIPAGPQRLFEVSANDASHAQLYAGSARADIVAGASAVVIINLGQSTPGNGVDDAAPVIDYVSASQSAVPPGGKVRLGISAHDPDPLDTVTLQWSASCGTFDATTASVVTWTAPGTAQRCQITATASDNRGASVSLYLTIDVVLDTGDALVQVVWNGNASPVIAGLAAHIRFRNPVEGDLAVTAADPDGDPLGYAWASSCASVTFGSSSAAATTFVDSDGSRSCIASVTVTDGKGGSVIGSVTLPPRTPFNLAPVITHTVQPSVDLSDPLEQEFVSPGDAVVLGAEGYDPERSNLAWTWTATAGTLDGQIDVVTSPGKSVIVFHVPAAIPSGLTVTVKVADPQHEFTTHDFRFKAVAGTDPCSGQPDGTACNDGNPCTLTDSCLGGVCTGGNPVVCAPASGCKAAGVCQPTGAAAGTCTYANLPDGSACDDGRACTSPDTCASGACFAGPSTCPSGSSCDAGGACVCTPACAGKTCGPDGCGGSCGACTGSDTCNASGQCVASCTPTCTGKACGPDGCGGSCGTCVGTTLCDAAGQCVAPPSQVVPTLAHDLQVTAPAGASIDAAGNVYAAASLASIVDVDFQTRPGGPPLLLHSQGGSDGWVGKYDAGGDVTWAVTVGDNSAAQATDQFLTLTAVTQTGRVAITGKFSGSITFGSTTVSAANPTPVVAALSGADGSRLWVKAYDMGPNGLFQSLAANPGQALGRIAACGYADGAATALDPAAVYAGGQDATIGVWDSDGNKLWGKQIGTTALNETCASVAIDDAGNVLAVGQFDGATIDLGGGFVLAGPNSTARKFLWIARFDGATGATLAAASFSGTLGNAVPRSVAVAADGHVAVGGSFTGNLTIGASLTTAGSEDAFVALLEPSFAPTWNAIRIGGTALDLVRAVAFTSLNDIVALGNFNPSSAAYRTAAGGYDTTGNPSGPSVLAPPTGTGAAPVGVRLLSLGSADAMLVKLNGATGAVDDARSFGNAATQSGDTLAVNRLGTNQVVFTNTSPATVTYAPGVVYTSTGANDAALVYAVVP